MSKSTKKLDFSELTEVLPEKPTSWKCKQMKTFLKFVNLEDLNEKFGINFKLKFLIISLSGFFIS